MGLAALPPKKQRPEEEEEGDVMEVRRSRNVREVRFYIEVKLANFSWLKIKLGRYLRIKTPFFFVKVQSHFSKRKPASIFFWLNFHIAKLMLLKFKLSRS